MYPKSKNRGLVQEVSKRCPCIRVRFSLPNWNLSVSHKRCYKMASEDVLNLTEHAYMITCAHAPKQKNYTHRSNVQAHVHFCDAWRPESGPSLSGDKKWLKTLDFGENFHPPDGYLVCAVSILLQAFQLLMVFVLQKELQCPSHSSKKLMAHPINENSTSHG